jgi:hypothetical protein
MQSTMVYQLIVTDHVKGRQNVALKLTGWESDPEGAIRAYHELADDQADGTTVDLVQVASTSLMSSIRAARPETVKAAEAMPAPCPDPHPADVTEVRMTPPMARMLLLARRSGHQVPVSAKPHLGVVVALIDRKLLHTVGTAQDPHRLTDRGAVLADILDAENRLDSSWFLDGHGERTYTV